MREREGRGRTTHRPIGLEIPRGIIAGATGRWVGVHGFAPYLRESSQGSRNSSLDLSAPLRPRRGVRRPFPPPPAPFKASPRTAPSGAPGVAPRRRPFGRGRSAAASKGSGALRASLRDAEAGCAPRRVGAHPAPVRTDAPSPGLHWRLQWGSVEREDTSLHQKKS